MESLAEVRGLQEDNIDLMRKAAGGSAQNIKMKDGKLKMDAFTASAIMKVYDKVNPANKKKIETIINSGKKNQMMKLQSMAMKAIKSDYDAELDEAVKRGTLKDLENLEKSLRDAKKKKDKKKADALQKELEALMKSGLGKKIGPDWMHKEETELEEGKMKELHGYIKQGKSAEWIAKKMKVDAKTIKALIGSDSSGRFISGTYKNEAYELGTDEYREYLEKLTPGELDEAKYEIYHKDFSSAMQHAYKMAKKLHGITIDPKEIDDKVATGPKKPSSGKTNTYRLKGDRGNIQIQVANLDNKKYELNMYKEEVDLDEASARADAMRAMGRDKKVDPADVDDTATDADIKAASKNIMMQMRKVISLGGRFDVEFLDKKKVKVKPAIANAFIKKYQSMRRPTDKEKFQNRAAKSYKDLLQVLKSQYFAAACAPSTMPGGGKYNTTSYVPTGGDNLAEKTELDEALPPHLKKFFDKDGNPKSKEGKAAWERIAKSKGIKKYTDKQIKMAIGVAFDKRYVQGNMTGAAKTIEKIAKGLSNIEPVRDALRRANENTILDRIDAKLRERKNG